MRIAILDLYQGEANEGMRCIRELITEFGQQHQVKISFKVYDVRSKAEVPTLNDFDGIISSGGPGSPLDSAGSLWEQRYFALMDDILAYNKRTQSPKKLVFLICHSFQIFCRYYGFGKVCLRKSPSYGVLHVHKSHDKASHPYFKGLHEPFYIVDSRSWQVLAPPANQQPENPNFTIEALEKIRPHVNLERAVMAVEFTPEIFGTQFHPEADPIGMQRFLLIEEKKQQVIKNHGEEKYYRMLSHLDDPDKIVLTHRTILPTFLLRIKNELEAAPSRANLVLR
jgi:homoserine O-succinyltransferase